MYMPSKPPLRHRSFRSILCGALLVLGWAGRLSAQSEPIATGTVTTHDSIAFSTSWTTLTSQTIVVDENGSGLVNASYQGLGGGNQTILQLVVDGTAVGAPQWTPTSGTVSFEIGRQIQLSAGSHSVAVRAMTNSGTATMSTGYFSTTRFAAGAPVTGAITDTTGTEINFGNSSWTTIASQSVTIGAGHTGLVTAHHQGLGYASGAIVTRLIVDGVVVGNPFYNPSGGQFASFTTTRQLQLGIGNHTIEIAALALGGSGFTNAGYLSTTTFGRLGGVDAATATVTSLSNLSLSADWNAVASQSLVIGSGDSGLVDVTFTGLGDASGSALLRLMIDGASVGEVQHFPTPYAANSFYLFRQLNLAPGEYELVL